MNYTIYKNKYIKELQFIYNKIFVIHLQKVIHLQPSLKIPDFEKFCIFSYKHTKFPRYI
jgi:hypothetical protein